MFQINIKCNKLKSKQKNYSQIFHASASNKIAKYPTPMIMVAARDLGGQKISYWLLKNILIYCPIKKTHHHRCCAGKLISFDKWLCAGNGLRWKNTRNQHKTEATRMSHLSDL